jgi:hypothetical protein
MKAEQSLVLKYLLWTDVCNFENFYYTNFLRNCDIINILFGADS